MPELTAGRAIALSVAGEALTVRVTRWATRTYATSATLDLDLDEGAYVIVTGAATITLPPNAPNGWACAIRHAAGASVVSIAAGAGVTINSPDSLTTITAARAISVTANGSNTYYVDGSFE